MKDHSLFGKKSSKASLCRWALTIVFASVLSVSNALTAEKPSIMLAEIYEQGIDVSEYFVSEKLDGVRARWDGSRLVSRGGNVFANPEWFTKNFPGIPLDGELWIGHGRYEETSSVVRRHQPHEGWRVIRLMVFDLPEHRGAFEERVLEMNRLATNVDSPYLAIIKQRDFANEEALKVQLHAVLA